MRLSLSNFLTQNIDIGRLLISSTTLWLFHSKQVEGIFNKMKIILILLILDLLARDIGDNLLILIIIMIQRMEEMILFFEFLI